MTICEQTIHNSVYSQEEYRLKLEEYQKKW